MLRKNRLNAAVTAALGFTAMATMPIAVQAQDDQDQMVEEVVVTGSRIRRANLVSSSPVTQFDAEELAFRGTTRVEDFLSDAPAIYSGNKSSDSNGATGTATIDLRNLGDVRTMVLVNGRRLPPGSPQSGGAGSDINQIPGALIKRVEVLTGGASSTYGSDAVAGVVNFTMIDDFEGLQIDYQFSGYQHDNDDGTAERQNAASGFTTPSGNTFGGDVSDFSIIMGANMDGDRGNVTAYMTYRHIQELRRADRDYANCSLAAAPERFCGGSSTLPEGRFTDFGLASDRGPGSFDYIVQGDQFVPRDGLLYNFAPDNFIQRPDERYTGGAFARYKINEHVEAYGEIMAMDDRSDAQIAPSGAFFVTSKLSCGNPLLSDQQFDLICGQFGLGANDFQDVFLGRRNVEGGNRSQDIRHTSYRGVFGFRGAIDDTWSYDIYGQYSEVVYQGTYNNDLSSTAVARALDAVPGPDGTAVCRSATGDNPVDAACVPWNVFTEGAVTDEQLDYLYLPLNDRGTIKQKIFNAFVTGNLGNYGVKSPWADEGVSVVFGVEYRKEDLDFETDNGYQSGDGAGQGGPILPVQGDYHTNDYFTEISVPILNGMTFAKELVLDLGYRRSEYSTDVDSDTYKIAVGWVPHDDLKLRASFNRAVRAANVRELFRAQSIGLFDMATDPCSGSNPLRSFEECARTGVTAQQYGNIADSPAGQYNSLTGGNPDLKPEESDAWAFGFVYTPSQIDGLSITVDYFDIEVDDAISSVSAETTLTSCLDGQLGSCSLINRGEVTGTLWLNDDNIVATDQNIATLSTKGIDLSITQDYDMGEWGSLNVRNIATYVDEYEIEELPGAKPADCVGQWNQACGQPTVEWQNNLRLTWLTPWRATITAQHRFIDSVKDLNRNNPSDLDDRHYLDLAATYEFNEMLNIRAGVDNVMDKKPPIATDPGPGFGGNGNSFPGTYDLAGRYMFVGATLKF